MQYCSNETKQPLFVCAWTRHASLPTGVNSIIPLVLLVDW